MCIGVVERIKRRITEEARPVAEFVTLRLDPGTKAINNIKKT